MTDSVIFVRFFVVNSRVIESGLSYKVETMSLLKSRGTGAKPPACSRRRHAKNTDKMNYSTVLWRMVCLIVSKYRLPSI